MAERSSPSSSSTTTASSSVVVLAGKSDAEVEELLDRMLTRLALCDDSNLEPLLSKLLPLCISSLSSNSISVRNKVLEILSHVNKRVKLQPDIGLPLSELWGLYSESGAAPIIRNFCIVYIEMAFQRTNAKEKEDLAPVLLVNISKLPLQHQEIILRIIVKVIGECHSRQIGEEVAAKYKNVNNSQDMNLFIEFCLHTILYQRVSQSGGFPGLSVAQANRVTGKQQLQRDELLLRKLGILNVIQAMDLAPELAYPLYIAASVDCEEPVVKRGEELLKKKASGANLDDLNLINRLFLLFNGTSGAENVDSDARVSPASPALKAKLMSIFCRSIAAANCFPPTLQCIFGCIYGNDTTSRLKQLGMEFTVWVFKHAKIDQLKLMGPVILSGIMKSLDNYSSSEADASAREVKTYAFQAIGLLAQRLPHLFREKIDMAARLFHALKVESHSLRFVVQEATISVAAAYKGAPLAVVQDLETLLLNNSQVEESEVRFCAVRWATSLFDFEHCPSRFICMLGAADTKLDIREMALEGLCLLKSESQTVGLKYPKLRMMLDYIVQQQPKLLESTEIGENNLIFPSNTYVAMIKFLLKCFESELNQNKSLDDGSSEFSSSVKTFCLLLEHSMSFEGSVELHANASKALVIIGSHVPEVVASHYALKVSWLKQLLSHVDWETRESVARLLGIVSSALSIPTSSAIISELTSLFSQTHKSRFETQHGALCAIGYVSADILSRTPSMPDMLLQNTLRCLVDVVKSETSALAAVAMQALGHIGLRVSLPPADDSNSDGILTTLHDKLSKLISGDDIKAIQKIVISIGHICVKETSSTQLDVALNLIFSLSRSKVEDVLFAAGEAISFLWGGVPVNADIILKTNYTSLSMASNFLMGDLNSSVSKQCPNGQNDYSEDYHAHVRDAITKKLFDTLLYSSRKEERCAGTVWLVSLTKYCGHHPTIQRMLPEIQEAFSHLLGEQNELTQDLASQGMSIVYDLGDESMKKSLVNALVNTLTGSGKRKRAIKLVEDTEVFQEGALGESASGGKLNTYKELCNLANEMGQPDLIYKFMDLANYQSSLNSKRGAAFGFSKIAKQAGDALKPHLRSLIPRLVRYQYDPDKNVQDAMVHIWKSLVADSKKTIDENLDLIIDDLLVQCGSRLWRSREASCLALADVIQGRKFYEVEKHLKRLWSGAFRAMDDIKETVRISGERLCRAVTTLTTRLCDVSLTDKSDAHKAMDIVLPFLLTEGILSKVDSIRKASIGVVMKLTKHAGTAICPHLSDLVCCMLESLSSLEDQGLNYVELHAANVGIESEKLERLRISIAKGSPMWETLDLCIKVVDAESLNTLIPRLAHLVRSGVGLNTRVGVANFITLLLESVGVEIKPFATMLVRLLFPVVKEEKSVNAKRAFASACAKVLKYIAVSQAQKLIEDTAALHAGDKSSQIACAYLLKSYSSMAADVIGGYQAVIIPVVFISRFEDDKSVSSLFEELWEEYTSGERITLNLYLGEIVSLICEGMSSSSWASKRKSAQAICKLSEVLGESLSSHHEVLLQSLMNEIPGRLWEGKDALLLALGALSTSCHKAISAEGTTSAVAILNAVSSACSKKEKKYREAAFSSLEQVIKAFGNPDFFNMVFPLLLDISASEPKKSGQAPLAGDASKTESDKVDEVFVPHNKVVECLTSCIHVAHMNDILEKQKSLMHMYAAFLSPEHKWTVKTTAFLSIKELCSRLHNVVKGSQGHDVGGLTSLVQEMLHSISPKILHCISTVKIAQVHVSASECLVKVLELSMDVPSVGAINGGFKDGLLHLCETEKNEEAKSLLRKCVTVIQHWKH